MHGGPEVCGSWKRWGRCITGAEGSPDWPHVLAFLGYLLYDLTFELRFLVVEAAGDFDCFELC